MVSRGGDGRPAPNNSTLQLLGNPQRRERLAGAAGHDESATVLVLKPVDHSLNCGGLVGTRIPPGQRCGRSSNLNRPLKFLGQEVATQDKAHRLLLSVQRSTSRGSNVVRGRHQETIGKLGAARLGQERVDFAFWDRSIRMIGLRLNRPQFAGSRASDDVDSRIGAPPLRPVLPQPDFVELSPIPRRVLQEPFAQPFKVATERSPFRLTTDLGFDVLESPCDGGEIGSWHVDFVLNHRNGPPVTPLDVRHRFIPHAAMSEMFQASRVPSGHGFPSAIKNPQPDGMRLANISLLVT